MPQADDRFSWWREARFGMFIHWGLYALPAGVWKGQPVAGIGEWIMNRARIPVREYERLAERFNPVKFDARAWVRVAKDAGMRYIVITSKHHDGFAMFDSPVSKYDIMDATPFGRDPMRELAEACREAGLRLCFYYSQAQDWHDPDAAGNAWDYDPEKQDFARYYEAKAKPQVREILTQYGPIGLIWFDTPRVINAEQSAELTALVHELQPACLVNSRVGHGAGDYESAGDNQIPVFVKRTPWETPATLNNTWGFKSDDHNWKEPRVLIRLLADIVGKGGNYLLNVGPTAEGEIPTPSVERLRAVGAWMRRNGEAIYGCGPSPFPAELESGAITCKPGHVYLHLFEWPGGSFIVRGLSGNVRGARVLASGAPVEVRMETDPALGIPALRLTLPAEAPDADVSVVALDLNGEATADQRPLQASGGTVMAEACLADRRAAPDAAVNGSGLLSGWTVAGSGLGWTFGLAEPGHFDVELWTQAPRRTAWQGGYAVRLSVAGQDLQATLAEDDRRPGRSPHQHYSVTRCGRVSLAQAGWHTLSVTTTAAPEEGPPPLLRAVRLVPARS